MNAKRKCRLVFETLEDRYLLATRIWDGGGLNNNWANPSNWVNNIAPVAGDDLVFPSNIADEVTDNNFADGTLFRSISVHGGYTLRGNKVLLGEGGIVSSGSSNVINNDFNLGAGVDRTFLINSGSTLFIDGRIEGGNGLLKTGSGDLSFRANNSYTGLTDIVAGRLFIERDESLGASNAANGTVIRDEAQLLLNDDLPAAVLRVDEPITVEHGGSIRALNDVELRGRMVTNGTATLRHDGSVIERFLVIGEISGTGGVTIANGQGMVRFQGDNSYLGVTMVQGDLQLDTAGSVAVLRDFVFGAGTTVSYELPPEGDGNASAGIVAGAFGNLFGDDEIIAALMAYIKAQEREYRENPVAQGANPSFFATTRSGQRLAASFVGGFGKGELALTLRNTPPMAPGLTIDQTDITARTIVTVTGALVDPDGAKGLRLLVDWGDGSKKQILTPGLADFTLRHRYRRPGEFVARFKWIDQSGEGNSREFTVNVEPGIPLGGNQLRSLTDRVFALGLR